MADSREKKICMISLGCAKNLVDSEILIGGLKQENYTMVPKINAYLGTIEHGGNYMWAVASVVSATAPLFMIVMFFQRQLISGLTTGAVKG